jgi:effector-binding domain-containing protein
MSHASPIQVTHVAPLPTAVVRRRATIQQLAQVIPDGCGEVWKFLRAAGAPRPDRNVAVYFDGGINLECGVIVDQPFTSSGTVVCSATPGGRVATTIHLGPYDRLGDAHGAITQWCAAQGYKCAGPNWEIYGHWNDDPAQLRTDVFYLLEDPDPPATSS